MKPKRGFIPWGKIDHWLLAFRSIWVSTTRPDGRPHAVPVWFVWDQSKLYFISARQLQKSKKPRTPAMDCRPRRG